MKYLHYSKIFANRYFWRNYQQKEVDYIEEINNQLFAYEFKWGRKQKHPPVEFIKAYTIQEFNTINRDNYLNFIT